MATPKKFNGQVLLGDQTGRTIGFRTANFDPLILSSENLKKGVYASGVTIAGKNYKGVLYYGPRLVKGEEHNVLEIHILDFHQDIYGEKVEFTVGRFIRGAMKFASLDALERQIKKDIAVVTAS